MSRDMMSAFELYQPDTVEGAVDLLGRFGEEGWALAGGNDSFDWFKDRVKRPKYVVDLGGIAALKGVRETDRGVEIGALTTLTEVERNSSFRAVTRSSPTRRAASRARRSRTIPATIGGSNVSQDARCWYYRHGVDCYRAPAAAPATRTRPKVRIASTASGARIAASP
jgi:xanthine dehydrogenase YagS FAD-binding subunit